MHDCLRLYFFASTEFLSIYKPTSMKTYIFVFAAFLLGIPGFCFKAPEDSKKLGLVSHLTNVKFGAELKMAALAKEYAKNVDSPEAKNVRKQYNNLKLSMDKLINQMSADMIDRNRMRIYRKINRTITGEKNLLTGRLEPYSDLLKIIDDYYNTFMSSSLKGNPIAAIGIDDALGAIELVHGIITDARDAREKKVQAIISVLEKLKLEKIKDLTEEKKDDIDKK